MKTSTNRRQGKVALLLASLMITDTSTTAFLLASSKPSLLPRSTSHYGGIPATSSTSLDSLPRKILSTLLDQQSLQTTRSATVAGGSLAFPTLWLGSQQGVGGLENTMNTMSASTVAAATTTTTAALSSLPDPTLTQEAHLLAELSHLGLDFATLLFGGTGVIALRAAAVLGRVCALGADYLPDHLVFADELVFQLFMLGASIVALVQAALPAAFAVTSLSKISLHDGKAFAHLFEPAGTTWTQFKALLSVRALEWITLDVTENNDTVTESDSQEDEYIYWLFSGAVQVTESLVPSKEADVQSTTATTTAARQTYHLTATRSGRAAEDAGRRLVGERRLLQRLGKSNKKTTTAAAIKTKLTLRATVPNTKLLRIHTDSLRLLMNNDQHLADAIRTLLFASMEAKLNHADAQQQQQLIYNNGTVA